jgi:hypothetical protein
MGGIKTDSGRNLKIEWNIPAVQVHYHYEGTFYMPLTAFPGAFADASGYVIFPDEESYKQNSYLDHRGSAQNPRVGVNGSISRMLNYVKVK